jgi:hypothetical protein
MSGLDILFIALGVALFVYTYERSQREKQKDDE